MISELITDHNRVGLPGLGTFVAEVVPATFSDKGYTINPPYRRLSFHPSRSEDTLLIDFYAASNGISKEAAGLYLKQFLGEMKSVLKERKTIMLPGLGRLRATVENNFFFVPDPDLDIYPDGFALKPLSLKTISMADEVEIPFFPPMEEEMEVKGAAEVEGEGAGEAEAREISENKEETGGPVSPESTQQQSEPTPHQASQPESEQLQPETGPTPQPEQQPGPGEQEPQSESEQSQPETELQLQAEQPQPESEQLQPETEPAPQPEQQPEPGEQEPQLESEQSHPETGLAPQPEQQPWPGEQEPQPQSEISQTQPQPESEQPQPQPAPQPQAEQSQPQPKQETWQPQPAPQPQSRPETGPVHAPRRFRWWIPLLILLAVAAVALLAFLTVAQVAPDFIDSILYTPEELRIINY